jgi:8-oxo-dGTP pyrophosphatase MutT (NUDIX family)
MNRETLKDLLKRNQPNIIKDQPGLLPAAVLVPLFLKGEEAHILLTKRTDRVENHKGQISFPGGMFHYQDMDCLTTALRETEEEVGIAMDAVEILGELDHTITLSKFRVCPYVGIFPYPYSFRLSVFEVERLIELPFYHLMRQGGLKEGPFSFAGESLNGLHIDYQGDVIWGATARMLKNLNDLLSLKE